MADALGLWSDCADSLREQVSDVVWQTTFAQAAGRAFDGDVFVVVVPSSVVKERIDGRYLSLVRDALAQAGADQVELRIVVETHQEPEELFPPNVETPDQLADVVALRRNPARFLSVV